MSSKSETQGLTLSLRHFLQKFGFGLQISDGLDVVPMAIIR